MLHAMLLHMKEFELFCTAINQSMYTIIPNLIMETIVQVYENRVYLVTNQEPI